MLAAVWLMLSTMLYSLQLNTGAFPKPLTEKEERYYLKLASDYNHHTKICYCAMLMGGQAAREEVCYG